MGGRFACAARQLSRFLCSSGISFFSIALEIFFFPVSRSGDPFTIRRPAKLVLERADGQAAGVHRAVKIESGLGEERFDGFSAARVCVFSFFKEGGSHTI